MDIVIAIDPSGNFLEGKGCTGFAVFDKKLKKLLYVKEIKAKNFDTAYDYWKAHLRFLYAEYSKYNVSPNGPNTITIVTEDYLLYPHKIGKQLFSRCETPKLIGILEYWCHTQGIPIVFQTASAVKNRWSDEILIHKNIITRAGKLHYFNGKSVNNHCRDAIRHGIH